MSVLMQKFQEKVIATWGEQGREWLKRVPAIIDNLAKKWSLSSVSPVSNMSYNYLALAQQGDKLVALKVSCDAELIKDEYRALMHFAGIGAIKVLAVDKQHHALLLEQAIPADLLKKNYLTNIEQTIVAYSDVAKLLMKPVDGKADYPYMRDWCKTLDRVTDSRITHQWLVKAKKLSDQLLNSVEYEYLCHADLHLENIISHKGHWLAIDPKGVIGELAFEAAAFDLITETEAQDELLVIESKMKQRAAYLASSLNINLERLLGWFYVRAVISAQWFIEDNGDPSQTLKLVEAFYSVTTD